MDYARILHPAKWFNAPASKKSMRLSLKKYMLLAKHPQKTKPGTTTLHVITPFIMVWVIIFLVLPKKVLGQGGCGSVCVPLDALDPEKTQVPENQLRVLITTEYAEFNNFREGSRSLTNPGGNQADISQTSVFIDYGLSRRVTISLLVPYVYKKQTTKKFGERIAKGVGDLSLFGRYEIIFPTLGFGPSIALGLGLKFPTGSIDEPGKTNRLPPAFQVGSGAYDLVPTLSYFQSFESFSLFGNTFMRIPLESNKRGYKFGREYEAHFGLLYPLPFWNKKVGLLLSLDYLYGEHDEDSEAILPAKLLNGRQVLNTGGEFLDITPGLIFYLRKNVTLQSRFFVPLIEDWNGLRARNVGQVAPDLTYQFSLSYTAF